MRKVLIVIILVFGVTTVLLFTSRVLAQQNKNTIASDLALDLELAQKNPAPEAIQINNAETKTAEIATKSNVVTVKPEEALAPEVKTQSLDQVVHSEQVTSEQVVVTPVVVDNNNNPLPSPTESTISNPLSSPSDSTAPVGSANPNQSTDQVSSSANPTASPDLTSTQTTPAPADQNSSTNTNNNVPGTTIPEPDDNSAPKASPASGESTQSPAPASGGDTSTPAPAGDNQPATNQPATDQPTTDQQPAANTVQPNSDDNAAPPAVQGISKGPNIFQKIINFIFGK